MNTILSRLQKVANVGAKQLALLIDPDKYTPATVANFVAQEQKPDYIFVGGSLLSKDVLQQCLQDIKRQTDIPLVIFPGGIMQVSPLADAILLLSLISGRNPELLIGKHVEAVPYLLKAKIEIMPTAYMLIDGGGISSVQYMSNTMPIPANKPDIALLTAHAGKMLGLQLLYLDAGSGAKQSVPVSILQRLKNHLDMTLIVGGGIRSAEDVRNKFEAGADVVVIGNAIESNPEFLVEALHVRNALNA